MMQAPRYVIVTPVRDEAPHISETIISVIGQSHRPERWVIVDDGSSDQTPSIIDKYARAVDWITVLSRESPHRNLGSAEIIAFKQGLEVVEDMDFEFLVKLDGDVRLEADYFQKILTRMSSDPAWGIASGIYWERRGNNWIEASMPSYHAAGASKVIRRECYASIGGFVPQKGWDTLDEIRAGLRGWRTGHFADCRFYHLKCEGAAMGGWQTQRFHGEIYYETGGGVLFLLAKGLHRMLFARPLIIGGLAMMFAYLRPLVYGKPRLANYEEARFYRTMLNRRLLQSLTQLLSARRQ